MKRKIFIFSVIVLFLSAAFSFSELFAYDDQTTHPALTDEIVDFYNLLHPGVPLTAEQKEWVVEGAMLEDTPPRWINHFYDPKNKTGWSGDHAGRFWEGLMQNISYWILAQYEPVSSLNWLHNRELQSSYMLYGGDHTWERAIEEIKKGNQKEAYRTLGHILHLIEDASVPDHTRNDTHAHEVSWATGDYGSPYEEYAKQYTRQTIKRLRIAETLKQENKQPPQLPVIDDYLISLAKYSNGYFFSKDTIDNSDYQYPDINLIKENCDENFCYGIDEDGAPFPIVKGRQVWNTQIKEYDTFYELLETFAYYPILNAYFSRLSRKTVLYGAGVIELFSEQAKQPQKTNSLGIVLPPVISITGEAYRIMNFFSSVISAVDDTISFFSSFLSASVVNIPSVQPPAIQTPSNNITLSQDDILEEPVVPAPALPITHTALTQVAAPASIPAPTPILQPEPDNLLTSGTHILDLPDIVTASSTVFSTASSTATTTVASIPSYQGGGWSSGVSPNSDAPSNLEASLPSNDAVASSTDNIVTATTTDDLPPPEPTEPPKKIVYDDPVVINEIAWMGTQAQANDEWIELYNKTDDDIDLTGWTLESKNKVLNIKLTGIIKSGSYFILERTASTTTDQAEDMIFTGSINNSGPEASLYLKNGSTTIDYLDFGYWPAGGNTAANSRRSMERVSPYAEGNNIYNWKTYSEADALPFAKDAKDNNILGTPGAKNSATGWYIPAALSIAKDTIWRDYSLPYFVPSVITITASSTLTIDSGVTVKFAQSERSGGGMNVEGVLRADGTEQNQIIFTSSADDAADGVDTDKNGTSTAPTPADWKNINFLNSSKPSSFKYAQVRYGGQGTNYNPNGWYPTYTGMINIQNSSSEISHSVFSSSTAAAIHIKGDSYPKIVQNEIGDTAIPSGNSSYLGGAGIRLVDASSTAEIIGNFFENNTVAISSRSASTTPLLMRDNTFRGNKKNSEFYSSGWLNLDNSGNRDLDSKGGFHLAFSATEGQSVLLKADTMPYIFEGGEFITVNAGGSLEIEPGTVIKNKDITHTIRGVLTARGTAEKPIIFTALADDSDGYDSNFATSTAQDGDWKNIQFIGASSSESVLEYVEIKYGGEGTNHNPNGWYPTYAGSISIQNSSPKILNTKIENSRQTAVYIKGDSYPLIRNSVIKNTATPAYYFGAPNYNYGLHLADASSSAQVIAGLFENNDIAIKSQSASDFPFILKDNVFLNNNKNGEFSGYPNFNLENSGNRDLDSKGGFWMNLAIQDGQQKTLKADEMPYVVSYARVAAGGVLEIEPGAVIKFGGSNSLYMTINGTLKAIGVPEKPIVFTALADDSDGYDSNNTEAIPQEGSWKNIQFIGASSSDSILESVIIKYGGSGIDTCPYAYLAGPCMAYEGAVFIDGASPTINRAEFDRNLAIVLYVKGDARPSISNSAFTSTKEALATPSTTIGGIGISIGPESSPILDSNTYGGNAKDVVYR